MPRRRPRPTAKNTVIFRADPENEGYGTLDCSWEDEPRDTSITLDAARKFAEGWKAEFEVRAAW